MMPSLLAQVGPVGIVTSDEPARPGFPVWILAALLGVVAVVSVLTWLLVLYRNRVASNPGEYAFRALSLRLAFTPGQRSLLRRLSGIHGSASPVGLLLSDHALRAAVGRFEQGTVSGRDKRRLAWLKTSFGL